MPTDKAYLVALLPHNSYSCLTAYKHNIKPGKPLGFQAIFVVFLKTYLVYICAACFNCNNVFNKSLLNWGKWRKM